MLFFHGLLAAAPAWAQAIRAQPPKTAPAAAPAGKTGTADQGRVTLTFRNVDIRVLIQFIAKLTGKNYVVSDKVGGRVTIISPGPVTVAQALDIFQSVLQVNGFTTVPMGQVVKVIPIKDARRQGVVVLPAGKRPTPGSEQMVTQMILLKHASASEIRSILIPLAGRHAHVTAHQDTNSLIITDTASNVRRLATIAQALDAPGAGGQIVVITLKHGQAKDMAAALNQLFSRRIIAGKTKRAIGLGMRDRFKALPDERTNSLILLGAGNDTAKAREIIARLDLPEPEGRYNVHVIHLKHAVAADLAEVLGKLSGGATPSRPAVKSKTKKDRVKLLSGQVKIVADPATNSLVVSASPQEFKVIRSIVAKLDIPRTMVYVEAVILEMTTSKSLEFGINWHGINDDGSGIVFGSVGGQVPDTSNPLKNAVPGFSFGVIGPTIKFGNLEIPNLSVLLKAVQTDTEIRVVATPQILTADNEEATIRVAQNLPFVTRIDQGTSTTDRAIQNFEYRDVGYTLKVTPRISEGGTIRLGIEAEHKAVVSSQTEDSQGNILLAPTTNVRTAKTVIVTRNNEIVVIGGLIGSELETKGNQVPCLGNIPVMGWAFKSTSDKGKRTNLLIFLSPHILASAKEARRLYDEKMKESREGAIERPEDFLTPYRPKTPDPAILDKMRKKETR